MESSRQGISPADATSRLAKHGSNELEEKEKKPAWYLFLTQFKDFMIVVRLIAANWEWYCLPVVFK